ncbi:MAG: septum formation initiator family protein [Gemmatimonadetes bacterium]|nr:septum formation initiator family protein [Gemmatimonadota bacterium]
MKGVPRLIMPALLMVAAYYAVFGGEYSLFELRSARASVAAEQATLGQLESQIDSLDTWADSVRTDSATLERIARERFGMIRDGETLYRFVSPEEAEAEER